MATYLANTNGFFDQSSTWVGGIVPGASDIAVANGKIVSIRSNTTCLELRQDTTDGATNGGTFKPTTGVTIQADVYGSSVSSTYACITHDVANSLVVIGNIVGGAKEAIKCEATAGNLEITGNVSAGDTYGLYTVATGSLVVTGTISGGYSNVNSLNYACIRATSIASITVNGTVGSGTGGIHGIRVDSNGTIQVNGDVISSSTLNVTGNPLIYCIYAPSGVASCVVTGNLQTAVSYGGNCIFLDNGAGLVRIDGNITKNASVVRGLYISNSPSCNVTINGNITGVGNNFVYYSVYFGDSPNLTCVVNNSINGNGLYGYKCSSSSITINGDLISSSDVNTVYPLYYSSYNNNSIITVNGNVISNENQAIYITNGDSSGLTLNVIGNVYAGKDPAIQMDEDYDNNFNCKSDEIVASEFNNAIYIPSLMRGNITIEAKRILNHSNGTAAIYSNYYTLVPVTESYIRYPSTGVTGAADEYLFHHYTDSLATYSLPPVSAVRAGVTYASGALTGTCVIPEVSAVLFGTEVDSGLFGTAYFDASLIDYSKLWGELTTSAFAPSSFGERLKDSVTTEAAGKIIQSFGL
jgi:hypothetical protein